LLDTKVFWMVVLYTIVGAHVFIWLERPTDLERSLDSRVKRVAAREVLLHK
jgi:hypothetical protein